LVTVWLISSRVQELVKNTNISSQDLNLSVQS